MVNQYCRLSLLNFLGCIALNVTAQDPAVIETLVVYGKPNAQLVGAEQHQNQSAVLPSMGVDASEKLLGLQGVQIDARANYAQDTRLSLRGFGVRSAFGVRGILLIVDGAPLTMPDGQGQFSGAVLDNIESAHVLSGPVAVLYGNAAGGVVQLKTAKPQKTALEFSQTASDLQANRQKINGSYFTENIAARLTLSQFNAEGYRPHANAEKQQQQAQIFYQLPNELEVVYRFDHERDPLLQDPLALTYSQWATNPYQKNTSADFFNTRKLLEQTQNTISLKQINSNWAWQLSAWQGKRWVQQFLAQSGESLTSSGGVVDLSRIYSGMNANFTWHATDDTLLTFGANTGSMSDVRRGYVNNKGVIGDMRRNEDNTADNNDIYAIAQGQWSSSWRWLLGVRQVNVGFNVDDHWIIPFKNKDDSGAVAFSPVNYAGLISYDFNANWAFSIATGSGAETPTLAEMAYTNNDQGFNNSLRAASTQQQQISIQFHKKGIEFSANSYWINSESELVVDQSVSGRTTYYNAGRTQRQGIELRSSIEVLPSLVWGLNYNFLSAHYKSGLHKGNILPGVAPQQIYSHWQYLPFSNERLIFDWQVQYREAIVANDDNILRAPAYVTQDLALRGREIIPSAPEWHWDWWVSLINATNKKYVGSVIVNQTSGRSFESAEPRHWRMGISVNWSLP